MSAEPDLARSGLPSAALPGAWTNRRADAHAVAERPPDPHDDPDVLARVAWSVLAEPGDAVAGAVVAALGAAEALAWAAWAVTATPSEAARGLRAAVRRRPGENAPRPGGAVRDAAVPDTADRADDTSVPTRVLGRALPRWAPRFADLEPRRTLEALDAVEGAVLAPGRPGWPDRLDDLGNAGPLLLWVRGEHDLQSLLARSVSVVGARAATPYGQHVAIELGRGLATGGVGVVSGGAFGIDAAAHRGAVLAGGPTVAFLAGGVDRPSPVGNLDLLDRIRSEGGALVAESPPGTPPTRSRFLLRNRLIAAVTGATVVVEAAWRSGALSTAARAAELLRPVGAVPGPVTSMASVGCHRLLRDGGAVCVTDAAEVAELLGGAAGAVGGAPGGGALGGGSRGGRALGGRALGGGVPGGGVPGDRVGGGGGGGGGTGAGAAGAGGEGAGAAGAGGEGAGAAGAGMEGDASARWGGTTGKEARSATAAPGPVDLTDRADSLESRVLDALHRRQAGTVLDVARRAGLAEREASTALGLLELAGAVERVPGGWRRRARA